MYRIVLLVLLFPLGISAQITNKWTYYLEGISSADVFGMSVDNAGNSYVVGDFFAKLKLQDHKEINNPNYDHAGFLLKLSPDGKTQWVVPFMGRHYTHMDAVEVLSDGTILISGRNDMEMKLSSVSKATKTTSPGSFIAAYSPDGNILWTKNISSVYSSFSSLAADHSGNFYAAGFYHYNSSSRELHLPPTKGPFVEVLVKFNNKGEMQWERYMKHRLNDYNFTLKPLVKVGGDDMPVMSSVFCKGMLIGDNDSLLTSKPEDERDIYFIKWSKDGTPLWKKQMGGYSTQWLGGFDIDEKGNVFGAGGFYREFIVKESGITSSANEFKKKDGQGFVIFSLDKDGQLLDLHGHAEQFYLATPHVNDFRLLEDGRPFIAGTFWDTIQYAKANGELITVGGWPINNNALAGIFDEHGNLDTLWLPIFAKTSWVSSTHIARNKEHVVMSFFSHKDILVNVNGKEKTIKSNNDGRNSLIVSMKIPKKRKKEEELIVEACSEEMLLKPLRSFQLPTREDILAFVEGKGAASSDLASVDIPVVDSSFQLTNNTQALNATSQNHYTRGNHLSPECVVFPNPTEGPFTCKFTGINGDISMRIFSSTGCLLYAQDVRIDSSIYEQQFNLSNVASGTYLLLVEGAGLKKVFRIVKS
ncbi:MAG: hypothetical protein RLZZ543_1228 [Bacteroidota bacterium]